MFRTTLILAMLALASASPTAAVGAPQEDGGPQVAAAQNRRCYVWYKGQGRWRAVGPYTFREAQTVKYDYLNKGYLAYIGDSNGKSCE